MAQIKTSELTAVALDWAVAKCEGYEFEDDTYILVLQEEEGRLRYSTEWSQGGPIVELEGMALQFGPQWTAVHSKQLGRPYYGPTPLIAAMRCYVASKRGDTVEVPDALIK